MSMKKLPLLRMLSRMNGGQLFQGTPVKYVPRCRCLKGKGRSVLRDRGPPLEVAAPESIHEKSLQSSPPREELELMTFKAQKRMSRNALGSNFLRN
jgi:hypothetical protein